MLRIVDLPSLAQIGKSRGDARTLSERTLSGDVTTEPFDNRLPRAALVLRGALGFASRPYDRFAFSRMVAKEQKIGAQATRLTLNYKT